APLPVEPNVVAPLPVEPNVVVPRVVEPKAALPIQPRPVVRVQPQPVMPVAPKAAPPRNPVTAPAAAPSGASAGAALPRARRRPRNSEMNAVLANADDFTRNGFDLAKRGALYSARARFVQALQLIAQAQDAEQETRLYTKALAAGLTAMKESRDFVA